MKLQPLDITEVGMAANVCVQALLAGERTGAWKAVKYLRPHLVVKATRVVTRKLISKRKGKKPAVRGPKKIDARDRGLSVVVTIGAPGYKERDFVKACRRAGERFPVERVQLKHLKAK